MSGTYHVIDGKVLAFFDSGEGFMIPLLMVAGPDAETLFGATPRYVQEMGFAQMVIMTR
jgi:hypothetical protein